MRKLNVWGLADEDEAAPETRTLTDPKHPGEEFNLCLIRPGLLEQAAIQEVAEAYSVEFLTEGEKKGKPFLTPGGKQYRLNKGCIWEVSAVYALQGGTAADRYRWTDLLGVYLKRPRLWRQASVWAGQLLAAGRAGLGAATSPGEADEEGSHPSEAPSSELFPRLAKKTPPKRPAPTNSSAPSPTASAP